MNDPQTQIRIDNARRANVERIPELKDALARRAAANTPWQKTNEEYISNPSHCPTCDSHHIEGDSIEIDGKNAWQDIRCNNCGSAWQDIYTLTHYQSLD